MGTMSEFVEVSDFVHDLDVSVSEKNCWQSIICTYTSQFSQPLAVMKGPSKFQYDPGTTVGDLPGGLPCRKVSAATVTPQLKHLHLKCQTLRVW